MEIIEYPKGKPSVLFTVVLFFISLVMIVFALLGFWPMLFGLGPIAFLYFMKEGVDIDITKKCYRSYFSFFGLNKGNWKPIPAGTKIGVRLLKLKGERYIGRSMVAIGAEETTMEFFLYMPGPAKVVLETSDNYKILHDKALMLHSVGGWEVVVDHRINQEAIK